MIAEIGSGGPLFDYQGAAQWFPFRISKTLIFVLWLAWLTGLAVVTVLRSRAMHSERQQRAERRHARDARPRRMATRQSVSPDYCDQLVVAGIIRPAPAPEVSPDPATSM